MYICFVQSALAHRKKGEMDFGIVVQNYNWKSQSSPTKEQQLGGALQTSILKFNNWLHGLRYQIYFTFPGRCKFKSEAWTAKSFISRWTSHFLNNKKIYISVLGPFIGKEPERRRKIGSHFDEKSLQEHRIRRKSLIIFQNFRHRFSELSLNWMIWLDLPRWL